MSKLDDFYVSISIEKRFTNNYNEAIVSVEFSYMMGNATCITTPFYTNIGTKGDMAAMFVDKGISDKIKEDHCIKDSGLDVSKAIEDIILHDMLKYDLIGSDGWLNPDKTTCEYRIKASELLEKYNS